MVTDWNPLEIWFYNESYLRFCAEDYRTDNLNNNFSHLANNSVAKNSKNYKYINYLVQPSSTVICGINKLL